MSNNLYAQPSGKGFVEANDGTTSCFGYQLRFAATNVTNNGDGTCSVADQTGAGGGDAITVNTTAVVDPDFADTIYMDVTTALNVINWKFNYAETLAGNPALLVDECVLMKDASGGGFICEGSTADTNEQLYRFPDVNGVDTTTYFALTTQTDGTISDAEVPNTITVDLATVATTATTANAGDSATSFFSSGTLEVAIGGTGTVTSTGTGAVVLGTSPTFTTSIVIPNGTNPTVDAAGKIAVDTSAASGSGIRFYGDAAYTLPGYYSKSLVITGTTTASDSPFWRTPWAITIRAVHCLIVGGTNVVGQLDEYDANGANAAVVDSADITCTTTNANDDGTLSNPSIDAGDYLGWHTTSVSGTNTRTIITWEFTVDGVL